ncbi:MAG: hypothetical protein KAT46_00765, partial [Deltaproteobacteria bacterium]|nr:hypothetical protein [Deltaproteobacteria bacterium]
MSKKIVLVFLAFLVGFIFEAIPTDSEAMPYFSRRVAKDCSYCHSSFPKLNETGRVFKSNGYRFAENTGEGEWTEVKDWAAIPLSMEIEVEGEYDSKEDGAGNVTRKTELKIEEVEFISGGVIGKNGKISYLGVVGVEQHGDGTIEAFMGPAFIQVNDLFTPEGEGYLNLKAGQWSIGLPFLSHDQRVVKNKYLADTALGVLTHEQRSVELNGQIVGAEDSMMPTHRYYLGLTREEVSENGNGDTVETDPMKGWYATYSATFKEKYNFGLIYRYTEEAVGTVVGDLDIDQSHKYGLAVESKFGPVELTAGYFIADGKNGKTGGEDFTNYMVEARYKATKKIVLGARYDV